MKKKILIVLTLVMIFTMSFGFALNKADELNTLKILKGYDGDYQLEAQLTRAQALTFVVRLIGKESLVLDKAELLKANNFKDVEADKWYAAYTGYGKAFNLVQGYPDGTFRGDEYLNEREFYAMVLNALKIDFEWDEVENIAYENNLIQDKYELNQTEYLRESVVDVLYTTLDNRKDMINDLVSSGVVTQTEVDETLVSKTDELKTGIKSVVATSKTKTKVTFNENISSVVLSINDLVIRDYDINGSVVTITNDNSDASTNYELVVSSVTDENGFIVNNLEKEFVGFKIPVVESDYFYIKDVEGIDDKTLKVTFTQPININVEIPLYYEIYDIEDNIVLDGSFNNLLVKKIMTEEDSLYLYLKNVELDYNKEYQLKISSDLVSEYGAKLDEGNGDNYNFYAISNSLNDIAVEDIIAENKNTVKITFNKEIDKNSANSISNYILKNSTGSNMNILCVNRIPGENAVRVNVFKNLESDEIYSLSIDDVYDVLETSYVSTTIDLVGSSTEFDANELFYVEPNNRNLLIAYFDIPLNENLATNPANYTITGNSYVTIPSKVFYDNEEPGKVMLYLPTSKELDVDKEYTLDIGSGLKNHVLQSMDDDSYVFTSYDVTNPAPYFMSAKYIGEKKVLVKFSEPVINSGVNVNKINYRLVYKDSDDDDAYVDSKNVSIINGNIGIITFDEFKTSKNYKIEFNELYDYSGDFKRTHSDGKYSKTVEIGVK